ncbi:MAG: hypothetical protein M1308_22630 [Actinobacteria bacterium]|nr:hypothetical protein [Actinomycetota bacterium]
MTNPKEAPQLAGTSQEAKNRRPILFELRMEFGCSPLDGLDYVSPKVVRAIGAIADIFRGHEHEQVETARLGEAVEASGLNLHEENNARSPLDKLDLLLCAYAGYKEFWDQKIEKMQRADEERKSLEL